MKNEKDVKAAVKKIMGPVRPGLWWYMPSANGFGTPGIPDFIGAAHGQLFGIETKFGSGKRTEWQVRQADRIQAAGGKYWLVSEKDLESFAVTFPAWMELCS